jgi:predicted DNA-binding transcriptional regulator YafY
MARTPDTRLERIGQIERRLAQRPIGWTASELAQEFAVSKPTILRDLALLQSMGARLDTRGRRYILDTKRLLYAMKVSTDELLAIYLAVRLLSRHSDEHNPHVVTAMEKLAEALQARSPLIAHHIEQAATAVRARHIRREYVHALEVITQGWAEGKKVRLRYHSYSKDEATERTFAPYFVEPSGIGYACYVIGYDDLREAIRTLKVERVYEAQLTEVPFRIPADFDPQRLLASAWGVIWRDEGEITVTLRFAPHVVRRVKESVWHLSQRIEDLPDGSCLFSVRIGSTKELLPWVRSWGAAVEVVEPLEFREEMVTEVKEVMHVYSL